MNRMSINEMRNHKWVVSWSGGKDSTATIILMHENKIPIKKIVYVRMMFDDNLPATLPVMTGFVDTAMNKFKKWGYEVDVVMSTPFIDYANKKYQRSKYPANNGKPYGITVSMRGHCRFTQEKQSKLKAQCPKDNYEMIGYAKDETARLERLIEKNTR